MNIKCHLWKPAGLFLAATVVSPTFAQGTPRPRVIFAQDYEPIPNEEPELGKPETLPQPQLTVVPAQAAANEHQPATDTLPGVLALTEATEETKPETLPQPRVAILPPRPAMAVVPVTVAPCCSDPRPTEERWFWQRWHAKAKASCWGYAEEFGAPPLGSMMAEHFQTQVANGDAARMVLCRFDFLDGASGLKLRGYDELTKIAALLTRNDFPIVIERTPEAPLLAESRRLFVLESLRQHAISVPPERVVIGLPIAHGLAGFEARQVLYPALLANEGIQALPLPLPLSQGGTAPVPGSGGFSPQGSIIPGTR